MRILKKILIAIIALGIVFMALCSISRGGDGEKKAVSIGSLGIGTKKIELSAGSFPADTQELKAVLQSGETAKLAGFTALTSLDASGSDCLEELAAWGKSHPSVALRYTVELPDGQTLENSAGSADLSGMDAEQVSEAAELLRFLPELKTITLGSLGGEDGRPASLLPALRESFPEAEISFAFSLAGEEIDLAAETLDLSALPRAELEKAAALLPELGALREVELGQEGGELTLEDVGVLQAACPETVFRFGFERWGVQLNTADEDVSFSHITMDDGGASVKKILPYMTELKTLDMDFCGVGNAEMQDIRESFPEVEVIWRIWFGQNYSVRTNVEKILASSVSQGGQLGNADVDVLKYCTKVKYLDLGHNSTITDISFARSMPELEVFIIAINDISDISPLEDCHKLEYLEINTTHVTDLSPLANLTELRHLNVGNNQALTDISPLYGLTGLERLWIGANMNIPAEQIETMRGCAPDCVIDTESSDTSQGSWRYSGYTPLSLQLYEETGWLQLMLTPRYELLRQQFGYDALEYSFSWLDPLY